MRPSASANSTAKTTSGRMSPLVADANDIVGDHALEEVGDSRKRRRRLLLEPAERRLKPLRPCRAPAGKILVSSTIATAPNTDEAVQMMTIHSTERPAIRPPSAASRLFAIPVTSKATTSGMTVIFSALSHRVPTNPATPSAPARTAAVSSLANAPSERPMTARRAPSMRGGPTRSPRVPAAARSAQRGFLNLKMKRSVLPRDLRVMDFDVCDRPRDCAAGRCSRRTRSPRA